MTDHADSQPDDIARRLAALLAGQGARPTGDDLARLDDTARKLVYQCLQHRLTCSRQPIADFLALAVRAIFRRFADGNRLPLAVALHGFAEFVLEDICGFPPAGDRVRRPDFVAAIHAADGAGQLAELFETAYALPATARFARAS